MTSVHVDGLGDLVAIAATLRTKPARLNTDSSKVVRAVGHRVEAVAKRIAPVDTGFMRNAIGPPEFSGGAGAAGYETAVTSHADYSLFVEHGTERMAPQPFMGPALDQVTPTFIAAVQAISDPLDL